jgi:hypothetical protein
MRRRTHRARGTDPWAKPTGAAPEDETMTSGPMGGESPRWLLQPPASGEVQLHIAVGERAELTAQTRAALEQLIRALYQQDVADIITTACTPRCSDLRSCPKVTCTPLGNCGDLTAQPCLIDLHCKIKVA